MIASVQKKVPFTIIVPSYFPSDIRTIPSGISGPNTNEITKSIEVIITYYGDSSDKEIVVSEVNINVNQVPNGSYETFNINGVEVLDEDIEIGSATQITHGFLYTWNRNGINFEVDIYGYGQDEGKKVVESMIK